MPALTKDKLVKQVHTPTRVYPRSLTNNDVKRLGPARRISSKRTQTQSIQTQTVIACLILNEKYKQNDEGTQTNDRNGPDSIGSFTSRLVRFFGGTLFSFMKIFNGGK